MGSLASNEPANRNDKSDLQKTWVIPTTMTMTTTLGLEVVLDRWLPLLEAPVRFYPHKRHLILQ
jgi:hypothetical protein